MPPSYNPLLFSTFDSITFCQLLRMEITKTTKSKDKQLDIENLMCSSVIFSFAKNNEHIKVMDDDRVTEEERLCVEMMEK